MVVAAPFSFSALDAMLEGILDQQPDASVLALGQTGLRVDWPASLALVQHQLIDWPASALELVVPEDVILVIDAWRLCRTVGAARTVVRLAGSPDETRLLHFVDATHRHGTCVAVIEAGSNRSERLQRVETALSRPRVATMRKNALACVLGIDDATTQILGWTAAEMVDRRSLEFIEPSDQAGAIASWMDMLAVPGSIRRVRFRHQHRDGSWIWFETTNHNLLADPEHGYVLTEMVNISDEMTAQEELRVREYLLRRITESFPLGIFQVDLVGQVVYCNQRLSSISDSPMPAILDARLVDCPEADANGLSVRQAVQRVLDDGADRDIQFILQRHSGSVRHCVSNLRALFDEDGAVTGAIGCIDDITDRKLIEAELAQAREAATRRRGEARFQSLVQHASDMITVVTREGVVLYQSPALEALFGYGPNDPLATNLLAMALPGELATLQSFLLVAAREPDATASLEWTVRHADGSSRHVHSLVTNLLEDPNVRGLVLNTRDITEQKALEAQLTHQAFHDSLTGLANRALFHDRLGHALQQASRRQSICGVLMLDLDDFKLVNDSLGHHAGDQLLSQVAARFSACLRPGDTAARLGGDEFALLLEDIGSAAEAVVVAERLLDALVPPCEIDGRQLSVRVSIGIALSIALSAEQMDGPHQLLRDADIAMYAAKAQGRARYSVYNDGMAREAIDRLELEADLRQALQNDELRVFYQPIVNLPDEDISEVEALVRWQHPRRGLLSPLEFISLAEDTGLIVPLGQFVLETACRDVTAWQQQYPGLGLSVNLSARQFQHPWLIADIEEVLRTTLIPPGTLKLEITESLAMHDASETIRTLQRLKALGVQLAIDDFGTGYSSLAYLKEFPVDTLKIDRAFVDGMSEDVQNAAIVATIVSLARNMGLNVTAEGIERVEDCARLVELGCERGQGYLFARPLAAADLSAWLAAS